MKIQETFTAELTVKTSQKYLLLKSSIESSMEMALKTEQPAIEKVDLFGFRAGSVLADFDIIVTDAEAAKNITTSNIEAAVHAAITTGYFSGISVNTTYLPSVKSK